MTENKVMKKLKIFNQLYKKLQKTRDKISGSLSNLLNKKISKENIIQDIEEKLLESDMGYKTVEEIISSIKKLDRENLSKEKLVAIVRKHLLEILNSSKKTQKNKNTNLRMLLIIGVNGVGKTTTIAKLARIEKYHRKRSVLLVAADTFRAAAVNQLQILGKSIKVPVFSNEKTNDGASIIFDSINLAKKNNLDVIISDSSGRMHTKKNLMKELEKIVRVIVKTQTDLEIILVIDANTGQNSIEQTKEFNKIVPISNIILTKMDGSAKGGIIFPIVRETKIPIKYIGIGEENNDLLEFDPKLFADSIIDL